MDLEIVILGAGGHGRVILDICMIRGLAVRGFVDHGKSAGNGLHGTEILGGDELMTDPEFFENAAFIVGVGDREIRRKMITQVQAYNGIFATLIHPAAIVSPRATIGEGTLVNAGAVVNIDARIGEHCILNTQCSIDHDCSLGDNVHICPGATLAGGVTCSEDAYIGSGATVLPNCRIGRGATVGGGAIVISDVDDGLTFLGVAGRISERDKK